jgi:ankyrin repeat protein
MKIFSWMALGCATLFWTSAQATDWQVNGDIYLPRGQGVPVVYPVYGNEDKPLALSQLTIGNGQTFRNDPSVGGHNPVAVAYFSLPEELQEYLQRLGIVDRDGDLLSFTRDVTITCALHHPTTSGDSWRYKGMPEGNAAVRFFPFSGEPIGFAIPADMTRNALRTASLPNGFIFRHFPYKSEDEAWWAMRERSDDRFSAFASLLMLSDGAVYVSTEVLPPAGFQIRDGGDIDCFLMPSEKGQIDAGLERLNHQFDQDLADYMLRQFSHNALVVQAVADAYLKNIPRQRERRNLIDTRYGSHRYTALHLAALADRADVIRTLFPIRALEFDVKSEEGYRDFVWAFLNAQDTNGKTAMDLAFEMGHEDVLYHLLIRMFPCVAEKIRAKMATLAAEMEARRAALVKEMEATLAREMAARKAVLVEEVEATLAGEIEARRAALVEEMEAALAGRYWHDYTVFHLAALRGEKYANGFLKEILPTLPGTALLSARTQEGKTAFHLVKQHGRVETARLLVEAFAKLRLRELKEEFKGTVRLMGWNGKPEGKKISELGISSTGQFYFDYQLDSGPFDCLIKDYIMGIPYKIPHEDEDEELKGARAEAKREALFAEYLCKEILSSLSWELHGAVRAGDLRKAKRLLDAGVSTEGRDQYIPPLSDKKAEIKMVRDLFTPRGKNWYSSVVIENGTVLHAAVIYNRLEFVKELIASGADVKARTGQVTTNGRHFYRVLTPLHLASMLGHVDIARELIQKFPELLVEKAGTPDEEEGALYLPLDVAMGMEGLWMEGGSEKCSEMVKLLLNPPSEPGKEEGTAGYAQGQVDIMGRKEKSTWLRWTGMYSTYEKDVLERTGLIFDKMTDEQKKKRDGLGCTFLHRVVRGMPDCDPSDSPGALHKFMKMFFVPEFKDMWRMQNANGDMPLDEAINTSKDFLCSIILQESFKQEIPVCTADNSKLLLRLLRHGGRRPSSAQGMPLSVKVLLENFRMVAHGNVNKQEENEKIVNEKKTKVEDGETALHIAVGRIGNPDIISALLAIDGINVNIQDEEGQTPLHCFVSWAKNNATSTAEIAQRTVRCAEILLADPRVDMSIRNKEGITALTLLFMDSPPLMRKEDGVEYQAIQRMFLTKKLPEWGSQKIELLLQWFWENPGGELKGKADRGTALHWAVQNNGPLDVLQIFCANRSVYKNKRFFATQDGTGRTALHWAAEMGNIDAVLLILDGMIPTQLAIQDGDRKTAKDLARGKGHKDIARILDEFAEVTGDRHEHLLRAAAKYGRMAPLQWFWAPSPSFLNSKDGADGRTALHWAAFMGHEEVVAKLLREPRIEVNIQDNQDRTPLYYAVWRKHTDIVEGLLAESTIDVNIQSNDKRTALHQAVVSNWPDGVRLLLNKEGIDISLRDNQGKTPLDLARGLENAEIIRMLEAFRPG